MKANIHQQAEMSKRSSKCATEKNKNRKTETKTEKKINREKEKQKQTNRETETEKQRNREKERETEKEKERNRELELVVLKFQSLRLKMCLSPGFWLSTMMDQRAGAQHMKPIYLRGVCRGTDTCTQRHTNTYSHKIKLNMCVLEALL